MKRQVRRVHEERRVAEDERDVFIKYYNIFEFILRYEVIIIPVYYYPC